MDGSDVKELRKGLGGGTEGEKARRWKVGWDREKTRNVRGTGK